MFDLRIHNHNAWDRRVDSGNRWTQPVTSVEIAARRGEWPVWSVTCEMTVECQYIVTPVPHAC